MSDVFKKIRNAELRIQWSGAWNPFYTGANDAFPGIEVPLDLSGFVQSIKGMVIKVDNDYYNASVEAEVRKLFENVVGPAGPLTSRWVLLSPAYWTTSSHIRWVGLAADSIAFQIGTQANHPAGNINDAAPKNPYTDLYDFSPMVRGYASFWACFSFAEG